MKKIIALVFAFMLSMSFMPSAFMPSAAAAACPQQNKPAFSSVLSKSPTLANFLLTDQIQQESNVDGDVIYAWLTPGADAEVAISQTLTNTMGKFDSRFDNGINPFSQSKWLKHLCNDTDDLDADLRGITETHWDTTKYRLRQKIYESMRSYFETSCITMGSSPMEAATTTKFGTFAFSPSIPSDVALVCQRNTFFSFGIWASSTRPASLIPVE